jgi:hypothetical protein
MHAVAVRNELIDAHLWLPEAVFKAYSQAKQLPTRPCAWAG